MANNLTELSKSRRVVVTNDSIRVYLTFYGPKSYFTVGANGWTYYLPTDQATPTVGTSISGLAAATSMTWTGYDTPICVHVDIDPRWTPAKGYIRLVFEGLATWVA